MFDWFKKKKEGEEKSVEADTPPVPDDAEKVLPPETPKETPPEPPVEPEEEVVPEDEVVSVEKDDYVPPETAVEFKGRLDKINKQIKQSNKNMSALRKKL